MTGPANPTNLGDGPAGSESGDAHAFEVVELAYHEFAANLLFTDPGLKPYFATDRRVKAGGGSQRTEFTHDGDRWEVTLYYQDSGIVHPGMSLPIGTAWELQEMREFRLSVRRHSEEDPVGQQGFNAHLAPRWQGMKVEHGDGSVTELDLPPDLDEGVNVRITGSNIAFTRYRPLLQAAAAAVDVCGSYFDEPNPYSNVQNAEKYARVDKDLAGPVHARDGPIASMAHLLEHDRAGYRKLVQNDQNNHGDDRPGFYHKVTLGPRRVREAFPTHELPVEVKHYYAEEALNLPDSNPLSHPKVGASYQVNRWDGTLAFSELTQLEEELERVVYSVLAEAGLDLAPSCDHDREGGDGSGPYVPDAYFDAEVRGQSVEPVALNLMRIRHDQESVVVRHLADGGFSPVQEDVLDVLVIDGGEVAPTDVAAEKGRHVESVRRALREMEDIVEHQYAEVRLKSDYVAELVHEAVQETREGVERAAETTAKALEAANRGLDETMSAFVAWAARHGVDVHGARGAEMELRFHGTDGHCERVRAINEGFEVWTDAGMKPEHFREATVRFSDGSAGTAFRGLNA